MNSLKLRVARIWIITALIFVLVNTVFPQIPLSWGLEPLRNILFQPSSLPKIRFSYEHYTFKFQVKNFYIRVAPFVIYHGEYYGLKQIVQWLQNNYPQVSYSWLLQKLRGMIHYGFNLTSLPQRVADGVDYLGFKLVDLNFPLSWFELRDKLIILEDGELSVFTEIWLPRANLMFSFEDLLPQGYEITHVNSTYILIGDVRGRRDLLIDPIIRSVDGCTVTGYAKGSECDFEELHEADLNGTLELMAQNYSYVDLSLTTQIKPAEEKALNLTLLITNFSPYKLLSVSGFNEAPGWDGWSRVGDSPWLRLIDGAYIYTSSGDGIGNFHFYDLPNQPEISSVELQAYCKTDGNDQILIDVYNGSSWSTSQIFNPGTVYSWKTVDISSILNTWEKVNSAQARLTHDTTGGADTVYVDSLRLNITAQSYVNITGTAFNDQPLGETNIAISGDGTYVSSSYFRTVEENGIDCSGFYDITINQSRWGIIWKLDEATYKIRGCEVTLGDGETETWFKDVNKQVIIAPVDGTTQLFWAKNNSHLQFGTLINPSEKTTTDGCEFLSYDYECRYIYGYAGSDIQLYSCFFISPTAIRGQLTLHGGAKIYHSRLQNVEIVYCDSGYSYDINNVVVHGDTGSLIALRFIRGEIANVEIYNTNTGIYQAVDHGGVFRDIKIRNCSQHDFLMFRITQDVTLINPDVDGWQFYFMPVCTAEVWRKYEFDLNVTDGDGAPLENCTVTLTYSGMGGGSAYSGLTGSNGSTPTLELICGFYNETGDDTLYDYNPYNLTIVRENYQTYSLIFNLIEKLSWKVALLEEIPVAETPPSGPFFHSYQIDYGAAVGIRAPKRVEPTLSQYLANTVPISVDIVAFNRLWRRRNLEILYGVTGPEGELILEGAMERDLDPNSQEELTLAWEVPLRKKEAPKNYTLSILVKSRDRILGDPVSYVITVAQSSWAPLYVLALLGVVCVVAGICYGGYRLFRREET